MTDKQIIIDGCDVSGCICYKATGKYDSCGYYCEETPNCYYKQLKRKEKECEQLKNLFKGVQKSLEVEIEECAKWSQLETETRYALLKKEQECEELKEGLNLILTVQKNCKECPHQKLDVDVLVCDLDCATAFKKIAKQTLKKLENKNV